MFRPALDPERMSVRKENAGLPEDFQPAGGKFPAEKIAVAAYRPPRELRMQDGKIRKSVSKKKPPQKASKSKIAGGTKNRIEITVRKIRTVPSGSGIKPSPAQII